MREIAVSSSLLGILSAFFVNPWTRDVCTVQEEQDAVRLAAERDAEFVQAACAGKMLDVRRTYGGAVLPQKVKGAGDFCLGLHVKPFYVDGYRIFPAPVS